MDENEKLKFLYEAQRDGISRTCSKYGISRTLYYRWLSRYKEQGVHGLSKLKGNKNPINKTSKHLESKILDLVLKYPEYGPKAIMYLLDELGYRIGESAVYNVMKRYKLNTKEQRRKYVASKKTRQKSPYLSSGSYGSGECWYIWITDYGENEGLGQLYEYVICDLESRIACSRLYNSCKLENILDLLTAVAVPVAQLLNFNVKRVNVIKNCTMNGLSNSEVTRDVLDVFRNWGMECDVVVLTNDEVSEEIVEGKKAFSHASMSILFPMIQKRHSFKEIKLDYQRWIRTYNIGRSQSYATGEMSPIEYHMSCTKEKMILPLWAYLDREY